MRGFFPQSAYGPAGFNPGSVGQHFAPAADNTYDLGVETSGDWRNIYFQGKASCSGSGSSSGFQLKDVLSIYNDGSNQLQFSGDNGRYFRFKSSAAGAGADVGQLTVDSGAAMTSGAYIIDAKNNGTSKWSVDDQGRMVITKTAAAGANAPTMINVPGTGNAAQDGWVEIEVGGVVAYMPYWLVTA